MNSYNSIEKIYSQEDFLKEIKIKISYGIKYEINYDFEDYKGRPYFIKKISVSSKDENDPLYKDIQNFVTKNIIQNKLENWQIFYSFKALFQYLIHDKKFNYFRGQSHNWKLLPGIFRAENKYREEFENIYKDISSEFPDKLRYFQLEKSCIEDRCNNIAILQHYGLKTSLLDISSNPFIAMLFMLTNCDESCTVPTLYCFLVDDSLHNKKNIFQKIKKNNANLRISAQKGAFLNFDKIYTINNRNIKKIHTVKIYLEFDDIYREIEKMIDILKERLIKDSDDVKSTCNSYIGILEEEKNKMNKSNGEKTKKYLIGYIRNELLNKLCEYYYFEEDLFPDFENRIKYIAEKYECNKYEERKTRMNIEKINIIKNGKNHDNESA